MIIVLIIVCALVLAAIISAVDCSLNINVTEYEEMMAGIKTPVKIVCISDLHGWNYGKDNGKLIKLIAAQKPDAIVIAGDMLTRRASKRLTERMLAVIGKLTDIAPVYCATGNHEADYMAKHGMGWLDEVAQTRAVMLYDSFVEAQFGESTIRIGAAAGRYFDHSKQDEITYKMLTEIGSSGVASIAVIHQPENLLWRGNHTEWSADLYLCGHNHGGVWRVPGVGGVMSPAEGLFPKYDKGRFETDDKIPFIINGGLSGYYFIPRVFNRPEICVIELKNRTDFIK